MGLNDKLKMAASSKVVETILAEGSKYTLASPKTQRRWRYVATRRLKDLQPKTERKSEPVQQVTVTETEQVVNRHKKYRKT